MYIMINPKNDCYSIMFQKVMYTIVGQTCTKSTVNVPLMKCVPGN